MHNRQTGRPWGHNALQPVLADLDAQIDACRVRHERCAQTAIVENQQWINRLTQHRQTIVDYLDSARLGDWQSLHLVRDTHRLMENIDRAYNSSYASAKKACERLDEIAVYLEGGQEHLADHNTPTTRN